MPSAWTPFFGDILMNTNLLYFYYRLCVVISIARQLLKRLFCRPTRPISLFRHKVASIVLFAAFPANLFGALADLAITPTTSWSGYSWSIGKFDTLGSTRLLTGVTLAVDGKGIMRFQNVSTEPAIVGGNIEIDFLISGVSTSGPLLHRISTTCPPVELASGAATDFFTLGGTGIFHASDLTPWQQDGSGGTIELPMTIITGFGMTGGSSSLAFNGQAQADLSVTYSYALQTTDVPEPSFYGSIGALVCLALLAFQHYRRRI